MTIDARSTNPHLSTRANSKLKWSVWNIEPLSGRGLAAKGASVVHVARAHDRRVPTGYPAPLLSTGVPTFSALLHGFKSTMVNVELRYLR